MPASKCHFDGEVTKTQEALDSKQFVGEEVSWKPVENEKQRWPKSEVTKTADLSGWKVRGLERWLSELP
jgi:hypothetical protein